MPGVDTFSNSQISPDLPLVYFSLHAGIFINNALSCDLKLSGIYTQAKDILESQIGSGTRLRPCQVWSIGRQEPYL